ncbi:MAG: UDP-N-acetylmuramate dehydrogenase [Clostridia bacterium]|nr:UDP-N-acetylmuramate dehydrogenase [Clostridia bacterium]
MSETMRDFIRTIQDGNDEVFLLENEFMSDHTTFRIGGPADVYVEPATEEAFCRVMAETAKRNIRTIVIGRGSNLLFDDAGFRGVVISTARLRCIRVEGNTLYAGAGASLNACANAACEAGLTGMEFAFGIPGSVGGAVFMNAGAYGGEICQILTESICYDGKDGTVKTLRAEEHHFGYRHSVYRDHPDRVVLSTSFALQAGDKTAIRAMMDDLMSRRMSKQPLECPSAGSAFKRCEGRFTAQMIDEAGLKGFSIGGAQVAEKHAGFIINRGGATSADVRGLIAHIQRELKKRFEVDICPEIVYVPPTDGEE